MKKEIKYNTKIDGDLLYYLRDFKYYMNEMKELLQKVDFNKKPNKKINKRLSELVVLIETTQTLESIKKLTCNIHLDGGLLKYLDTNINYISELARINLYITKNEKYNKKENDKLYQRMSELVVLIETTKALELK